MLPTLTYKCKSKHKKYILIDWFFKSMEEDETYYTSIIQFH